LDSIVQVGGVDQIEAGQILLRLGEGAISDGYFSVANAHGGSGMNGLKSLRGQAPAIVSEGLVVSHTLIIGHSPDLVLFTVDKTQVLHRRLLHLGSNFRVLYFNTIIARKKDVYRVAQKQDGIAQIAERKKWLIEKGRTRRAQ
jgi:hypothetical protein